MWQRIQISVASGAGKMCSGNDKIRKAKKRTTEHDVVDMNTIDEGLLQNAVRNHAFFAGMKPEHLGVVTCAAKERLFKPGDVIHREGEPANDFLIIQSGKVAIEAHCPGSCTTLVETLGPGEVLGWSWLFPPFVWHFRARAVERTHVIVLDGGHMLSAAETDKYFGYELMKRVTRVLIRRLEATRARMLENDVELALAR